MLIIKSLRKKKKETQSELAKAIGVSLRTIQHYEAGEVTIPSDKLAQIAQHYNVSIPQLYDSFTDSRPIDSEITNQLTKLSNQTIDNWDELMKIDKFKSHFYYRLTQTLNMDIDEIFAKVLKK